MTADPGHSQTSVRRDHQLIADMVEPGSRLLDIGCGDGALLELLAQEKNVDGRGIEISQDGVNACVSRGLSVIQGDAEADLFDYPKAAFDYVILSQTLPDMHEPRMVLEQLLRIGRVAIVSIPNFGYWRNRLHLLIHGRVPITPPGAGSWYDTTHVHPCTIRDFIGLCATLGITIERSVRLDREGGAQIFSGTGPFSNLLGAQAVFVLSMASVAPRVR